MEEEFKPEEYQGRTKEHVERNYMGIQIAAGFVALLTIILLTYSIVKFIAG